MEIIVTAKVVALEFNVKKVNQRANLKMKMVQ